jgi:hypothetical protein
MDKVERFFFRIIFFLISKYSIIFTSVALLFLFNNKYFDPWSELSCLFSSIQQRDKSFILASIIIAYIGQNLLIIGFAFCGYFFFAKKYFELHKLLMVKNKYLANFFETSLNNRMDYVTNMANQIEYGVEMDQGEVNKLQANLLNAIKSKYKFFPFIKRDHFITCLLEPSEIMSDPENNHIKTVKTTIRDASDLGVKLKRIIFAEDFDSLIATKDIKDSDLYSIVEMHKNAGFDLFLMDKRHIRDKKSCHDIDDEYLDFQLIDTQVIYGLKNNSAYKTKIASDKYTVYIKHSKKELKSYKAYFEDLMSDSDYCVLVS